MNTTVRCFATEESARRTKRRGVWLMTQPIGSRGAFYHGRREEIQAPRYTIEELDEWSNGGTDPLIPIVAITPEEALAEMDKGWPEAKEHMQQVFDRYRKVSVDNQTD